MAKILSKIAFPNLVPLPRASELNCPDCAEGMIPFSCQQHIVEKCPRCNGIWFTGKSFGVFRDTLRQFDLSKIDFAAGIKPGRVEAISACPRCEDVLTPFRYAYNSKVQLKRCERCNGLWLPFPELLNVLDLAKISQDIAPHVAAVVKEMATREAQLNRDRRLTSAMKELTNPVSAQSGYSLFHFFAWILKKTGVVKSNNEND